MVKVRAVRDGFFDGIRRRAGSTFDVPDKFKLGSWMETVEAPGVRLKPTSKQAEKATLKPKPE
jgi:hypothetical protein